MWGKINQMRSHHSRSLIIALFILILLILVTSLGKNNIVFAQESLPTPNGRDSKEKMIVVEYRWQLAFWSDGSPVCNIIINHENQPTNDEIQQICGQTLYQEYSKSSECKASAEKTAPTCTGLFLNNLTTVPVSKTVVVKPQKPSIEISMSGCNYTNDAVFCVGEPELVLTGEEPLHDQRIIKIQGKLDDKSFTCDGNICKVPVPVTDLKGIAITFWGDSSFGDSTPHYIAYIRNIQATNQEKAFYIDVISDQWTGKIPPSGSQIWHIFPESIDQPDWLKPPTIASELRSNKKLYYLAAELIQNGAVNTSSCSNGGLTDSITANECGVAMASPKIQNWQNQFDQEILSVAKADDIPAKLLKNIFLRESQLWPGIYQGINEVGLGQLTENGADTVLLWNRAFYDSFCPLVLDNGFCSIGFANLGRGRQSLLKGALLQKANAACHNCANGIDQTKVGYTIHVFAETIKANCSQVNQIFINTTQKSPREITNYSDLWRFTLVNYNAGAGCLSKAIVRTKAGNSPIDWAHVSTNLDPACRIAADYVVDITEGDSAKIFTFSTPLPSETPTKQATSTVTAKPTQTLKTAVVIKPTMTVTPTTTVTPTRVDFATTPTATP